MTSLIIKIAKSDPLFAA
jgi:TFIIF-interacting CTD phosphatase-like protein